MNKIALCVTLCATGLISVALAFNVYHKDIREQITTINVSIATEEGLSAESAPPANTLVEPKMQNEILAKTNVSVAEFGPFDWNILGLDESSSSQDAQDLLGMPKELRVDSSGNKRMYYAWGELEFSEFSPGIDSLILGKFTASGIKDSRSISVGDSVDKVLNSYPSSALEHNGIKILYCNNSNGFFGTPLPPCGYVESLGQSTLAITVISPTQPITDGKLNDAPLYVLKYDIENNVVSSITYSLQPSQYLSLAFATE